MIKILIMSLDFNILKHLYLDRLACGEETIAEHPASGWEMGTEASLWFWDPSHEEQPEWQYTPLVFHTLDEKELTALGKGSFGNSGRLFVRFVSYLGKCLNPPLARWIAIQQWLGCLKSSWELLKYSHNIISTKKMDIYICPRVLKMLRNNKQWFFFPSRITLR